MPVGEFLNSKTMLTKILLTYTTKLNVVIHAEHVVHSAWILF